MNVRPDIFNSTPTFMTGEDYIKGMSEDISLFDKAWEHQSCDKLLITNVDKNEEYPMNLHEKHNVSVPNNLEYKDNKLSNLALSEEYLIDCLVKFPKILERPIVIKGDQGVIGRPPENILKII